MRSPVPVLAQDARHLTVFQRHPHRGTTGSEQADRAGVAGRHRRRLNAKREQSLHGGGPSDPRGASRLRSGGEPARALSTYTAAERRERLERQWEYGGHGMSYVLFSGRSDESRREQGRVGVHPGEDSGQDCRSGTGLANAHEIPIGTRRLILEIGYYEAFNQHNVTLVDVLEDPILEITEKGVRTAKSHHDIDLLIIATGFPLSWVCLRTRGIRNDKGETPKDVWAHGPRALWADDPGVPESLPPTNAGSPSVWGTPCFSMRSSVTGSQTASVTWIDAGMGPSRHR